MLETGMGTETAPPAPSALLPGSARDVRPPGRVVAPPSFAIALVLCVLTSLGFAVCSEEFQHWFVIPVTLCGALIGTDVVEWVRRRSNLFDPGGILALLGVHFFFTAPLLHVAWDHWLGEVEPPADWRDWLGWMAVLNACGLLVYRLTRDLVEALPRRRSTSVWRLDRQAFYLLAGLALAVSGGLQVWVYVHFGGILGYIETAMNYADTERMQGMGWVFTISESFPIVALIAFAVYARGRKVASSWVVLGLVMLAFFVLKLLFGGLRGSRSTTIWAVFWAAGIIHLYVRRVPGVLVVLGFAVLMTFMYLYGLYKGAGLKAVDKLEDSTQRAELADRTHRTFGTLLLGDLGRSDVQAHILYRLMEPEPDYDLAWGRTYLGTLALLVPRAIWPDRPPEKIKEGTEIQSGRGSYIPSEWTSSRVHGLAGETMLNFGPVPVPFAFAVLGLVIALLRRHLQGLRPGDPRALLFPFWVIFSFSILNSDSDNLLFYLIKDGAIPFAILWFALRRQPESATAPAGLARNGEAPA
jgi:hypothetical protein